MKWEWAFEPGYGLYFEDQKVKDEFEKNGITNENDFIDKIEVNKINDDIIVLDIYLPFNDLFNDLKVNMTKIVGNVSYRYGYSHASSLDIEIYKDKSVEDESNNLNEFKSITIFYSNTLRFVPENDEDKKIISLLNDEEHIYGATIISHWTESSRYIRVSIMPKM